MGFLKKLKDTTSKGIEKGVEFAVKGSDVAVVSAKKGYEKANKDIKNGHPPDKESKRSDDVSDSNQEALKILKLRLVKGEITKKEFDKIKKDLIN